MKLPNLATGREGARPGDWDWWDSQTLHTLHHVCHIYAYIDTQNHPNVGTYAIHPLHGVFGIASSSGHDLLDGTRPLRVETGNQSTKHPPTPLARLDAMAIICYMSVASNLQPHGSGGCNPQLQHGGAPPVPAGDPLRLPMAWTRKEGNGCIGFCWRFQISDTQVDQLHIYDICNI